MGAGEESRSDAELLFAFRKGDVPALDTLIGRYQGQLHGYLRAMTGSTADADDLFQETWLRVVRNPGSFRGGAFNAWLWRITRNLLIDRLRRRKPVVSLDDTTAEGTSFVELTPAPGPDAGAEAADAELGRQIAAAVGRLPPDQRDVFLLRTQAGMSFAEIARLRRMPINTALGRMHYAIQRLRQELGQAYAAICGETESKG
ncbi:MAG: sigma-70 family RNA polymerase sigma factor [bacterium]